MVPKFQLILMSDCWVMPHFVISIEGAWDRVFAFKVSNSSDKYLPRHSIMKDCLESDVHHMTSQILSILIDFIQDRTFFVPFLVVFQIFRP